MIKIYRTFSLKYKNKFTVRKDFSSIQFKGKVSKFLWKCYLVKSKTKLSDFTNLMCRYGHVLLSAPSMKG